MNPSFVSAFCTKSVRSRGKLLQLTPCLISNFSTSESMSDIPSSPPKYLQAMFEKATQRLDVPQRSSSIEEERLHRKQRLAAACRMFAHYGYDEGVAGHITVRDPKYLDHFWVNPFSISFSNISVSNLICVDENGKVVEGNLPLNDAAFAIHSTIHKARPDVNAIAHAHSLYGKAFSTTGKELLMSTQDSCAFYNDIVTYDDYGGVAVEMAEGERICNALKDKKAAILQNHGLLTTGQTVDSCVWWYISLERCCKTQLVAEAALRQGESLKLISAESAKQAYSIVGCDYVGWLQFQQEYQKLLKRESDFML